MGGSGRVYRGTRLEAKSKLASVAIKCEVKPGANHFLQIKVFRRVPDGGVLRFGVTKSIRRAFNERRGDTLGDVSGTWAFDLGTGCVHAETETSGVPAVETFSERASMHDFFSIEIDRTKNIMSLYHNFREVSGGELIIPETGSLFPAFTISGGQTVEIGLGNNWGPAAALSGSSSVAIGKTIGEGKTVEGYRSMSDS